jgi:hypothetical protein
VAPDAEVGLTEEHFIPVFSTLLEKKVAFLSVKILILKQLLSFEFILFFCLNKSKCSTLPFKSYPNTFVFVLFFAGIKVNFPQRLRNELETTF